MRFRLLLVVCALEACGSVGLETSFQASIFNRRTDVDIKVAGFEHKLHVGIPKFEVVGLELEADALFLSGLQVYLAEALEGAHGGGDAADAVVQIKLHDFGSFAAAGVFHLAGDFHRPFLL